MDCRKQKFSNKHLHMIIDTCKRNSRVEICMDSCISASFYRIWQIRELQTQKRRIWSKFIQKMLYLIRSTAVRQAAPGPD
jgi:hypothetical protein